jgi:hypothetical protein
MKQNRGFTIVEMIIYCTILVSFLYVMTNMFVSILDMQLESETTSSVIQDSRYLFSRFTYDIGRATAITIPANLGEQSNTLGLTINGVLYTYALQGENLFLTSTAGTGQLNSEGTTISGLSFRRYGNVTGKPSVRIVFTLESTTHRTGGPEIRSFETTLGVR